MKVEWHDYLSIGVAEIDGQHKNLFERFNDLLAAWEGNKGADEVQRLFEFLDDYVVSHFADEELLMQRHGFPGYQEHRDEHVSFMRKVSATKERLKSEGPTHGLVASVVLTVNGWLISHISRADREIGKFIKERNKGAAL